MTTPKAQSVTEKGEPDGWEPESGWQAEMDPAGGSRLIVACATGDLPAAHRALTSALGDKVGVLFRERVDRRDPKPNGWPGRDFVALDVPMDTALAVLDDCGPFVYGDARFELWLRGEGEQIIMDQDGMVFVYPDAEHFREALSAAGIPQKKVITMADRNYVKQWFRAECDDLHDNFMSRLNLTEVPLRR